MNGFNAILKYYISGDSMSHISHPFSIFRSTAGKFISKQLIGLAGSISGTNRKTAVSPAAGQKEKQGSAEGAFTR